MSKPTQSKTLAEQRRALEAIEQALAAQNASLVAAHAQLDSRRTVPHQARAQMRFQELCTPPERRPAESAEDFNAWEFIRC